MMTDPIADLLTRIRNAARVRKAEVALPFSKLKLAIARILEREGYLAKVEERATPTRQLVVHLKYAGGAATVQSLTRISKPGHRRYVKKDEIGQVLNGFGLAILSTPRGVVTGAEAKKLGVGGELLCEVY